MGADTSTLIVYPTYRQSIELIHRLWYNGHPEVPAMNRIINRSFRILLIGFLSPFFYPVNQVVKHGTLIIALPTKVGLVVCGDKRQHNEDNGTDDDTALKVRHLDNRTIYIASGLAYRQFSSSTGVLTIANTFNLFQIIETWYSSHNTDSLFVNQSVVSSQNLLSTQVWLFNPWEDLKRNLELQLSMTKDFLHFDSDKSFFEILFFRVTPNGDLVARGVVHTNDIISSVQYGEVTSIDLSKGDPICLGSPEVYNELKSGSREDFNDLRINPYLKPFLEKIRPRQEVTPSEALAFEHTLIDATSERGQKLNSNVHVSKECNCALLSYAGQFNWISTDDYPYPSVEWPKSPPSSNQKQTHPVRKQRLNKSSKSNE